MIHGSHGPNTLNWQGAYQMILNEEWTHCCVDCMNNHHWHLMVMPAVLDLQYVILALCIELPSPTRIGFWFSTEGSLTFRAKMATGVVLWLTNYIMCKNIEKGIWWCVMVTGLWKTKKIPLPAQQRCPWVGTTLLPPEQLGRSRLKQRTQPARSVIDTWKSYIQAFRDTSYSNRVFLNSSPKRRGTKRFMTSSERIKLQNNMKHA